MEVGDKVLFVPSHDAEYNGQPCTGEILEVIGSSVRIRADQQEGRIYFRVNIEWVALLSDVEQVVALVRKVNDMALKFQSLLYLCEIHLDFDQKPWLYKELRAGKYHIN